MGSTATAPLRKVFYAFMISLTTVATGYFAIQYGIPHMRKRAVATRELDEENRTTTHLTTRIDIVHKNRSAFLNNPEFIELTAHRQGLIGPNEKVFVPYDANGKK